MSEDPYLKEIFDFASDGTLPKDEAKTRSLCAQESLLTKVDGIQWYLEPKQVN